ncbi:hypothetical protein PVK06_008123 [Gossypium arboreum]|uniref:Aminotransferase-like plant mobile domain-containing protein n=1 Tax=Gossypium arboreum TaxID=29729 RepID=A0ABR0QJG8_GOSAR|nr:hypothetical protein PVK06_008123 [Gossypium arboreum]
MLVPIASALVAAPHFSTSITTPLGLSVDGSVVTGSVHAADWRDVCTELLGRIPKMTFGGRIEMGWLRRNFSGLNEDSTEVQREQHARAYILQIIEGILMSDKSRNFVHLRMHPIEILGEFQNLAREGAIGSLHYRGDARVGYSVIAIRVQAIDSSGTSRPR